jgi:hypothetical protein
MKFIKLEKYEETGKKILSEMFEYLDSVKNVDPKEIYNGQNPQNLKHKVKTDMLTAYQEAGVQKIFDKHDIMVDKGLLNIIVSLASSNAGLRGLTETYLVQALNVNNEYYKYQESFEVMISPLDHKRHLSANTFKKEVIELLKKHHETVESTEKNKTPTIVAMKKSILVDNYETTCHRLESKFLEYGMKINYEETKFLIKQGKQLDKLPMTTTVIIDDMLNKKINYQCQKDLEIYEKKENPKIKDVEAYHDTKNPNKSINAKFTA